MLELLSWKYGSGQTVCRLLPRFLGYNDLHRVEPPSLHRKRGRSDLSAARHVLRRPQRFCLDAARPGHLLHPRVAGTCSSEACALRGAMMKRALFWGTIIAGAVAAYLMYRRGESMGAIAVRTVTNPVGSLVTELEAAAG